MNDFKGEISVAVGIIIVLLVVVNPWGILMPGYVVMGLLVALVILFSLFVALFWREREGDEREAYHRGVADRAAYLAGTVTLLAGIVCGELAGALDPWLVYALAVMLAAKVAARAYSKKKY